MSTDTETSSHHHHQHASQDASLKRRITKEVILVAVFYFAYSTVRNVTGKTKAEEAAYDNALKVIDIEKALGMFHEQWIQEQFIAHTWFIQFFNVFYGSAHFMVTIGVMVWLFMAKPYQYKYWRNVLAISTALALIGFAFFPLMPPRFFNATEYAKFAFLTPDMFPTHHFVDTLKDIGGLWNFESGPVNKVSNQFAAMPSLHICWATWCGIIIYKFSTHTWSKVLGVLYPLITLFCIVVTANHFIIDAAGGWLILALGLLGARWITKREHPIEAVNPAM